MTEALQRDYVAVTYSNHAYTTYPARLTRYLANRYEMRAGSALLDLGCGRGEFLRGFIECGLAGHGVDRSDMARALCPDADIRCADLGEEPVPYEEDSFDVVFSKSFLEHFYYPEKLVKEIHRVLKPGGLAVTMVPDWESIYRKEFYADYTHRSPFTLNSLREIFVVHGFDNVAVEKFRQLPFLWTKPWLKPMCSMVAALAPSTLSPHSKLVRFSKEIMLLSSGTKLAAKAVG